MKELVSQLCYSIQQEANKIQRFLQSKESFRSDVFDQPIYYEGRQDRPEALKGRHGVYVFLLKDDITLNEQQVRKWNALNCGGSFKKYAEYKLSTGDCLYVGDSVSNSLYVRTGQHFAGNTTCSSLNLKHSSRNILFDHVCVWEFPIKKIFKEEEYRIILPRMEKDLHTDLEPKCGSSRV